MRVIKLQNVHFGMNCPFKVCVCMRGSLALWPEMSHVADTAKAMCLNSVAFTHTHTHTSLMLKRKQATGGLSAYHNQTHGQCMCVCVCLSDLRCCQCWSSSTALLSSSQPALKNKHVLENSSLWLAIGCQEDWSVLTGSLALQYDLIPRDAPAQIIF